MKNALSNAHAIALSTFNTPGRGKEALPEFGRRLAALAQAHDALIKENWEGASLHDIVQGVIRPLESDVAKRFSIAGVAVTLPPRQVLAMTMVLHELCTNAAKYGALSNDTGHVELSWEVAADGAGRSLRMRWEESGGPAVTPPSRTGFGTSLMTRGFGRDLGSVTLAYPPEGAVCEILARLDDPTASTARPRTEPTAAGEPATATAPIQTGPAAAGS